jgi:hypothetical protein
VKHVSHIAGDFLRLLLRLVHLEEEIQREADFLGYEAYPSFNVVSSKGLSQVTVAVIAKKAESPGFSKESLPLKAA